MTLKNYTSVVQVDRTITEIEKLLIKVGAKKILKDYNEMGKVSALSFVWELNGKQIPVRLPARVERVAECLRRRFNGDESLTSSQRKTIKHMMQDPDSAERTIWRIMLDWLEANIAIMEIDQVNMMEALLPFTVMENGNTLYELIEKRGFDFKKLDRALEYRHPGVDE